MVNKWGSLDGTLYYTRKKIINKYIKFFDLTERKEIKTTLKDIYYKRFIKEDGEHLGNNWYVIDKNDKEYWIRVNTEIEIYKLTNKELDPYGEEDWA